MYCGHCGTQVQEGQKFCSRCGRPVAGPAAAPAVPSAAASASPPSAAGYGAVPPVTGYAASPPRPRVACHLRTLGILWIVVSAFRILPALWLLAFGHMSHMGFPFMPRQLPFFVGPILGGLGIFLSATAVIGLAAGWGLLERRPWARMLAIVIGCLSLLSFPFGTALGIYTLWVLASAGADVEYDRLAGGQ